MSKTDDDVFERIDRRNSGEPIPLSFAQERLWFLDQLDHAVAAYNIPAAYTVSGLLNVEALRRCFNEIVRRHESLRTVFCGTESGPVQVIGPPFVLPLAVVDLCSLSGAIQQAEIRRVTSDHFERSFDLATGPLIRALLIRTGDEQYMMLISMHHIISDGWSQGVLVRELSALYNAFTAGRPSPLAELEIQYADFAVWQRQWLTGLRLEEQLAFWKQQLQGSLPIVELPIKRPRPPMQTFSGAKQFLTIPEELVKSIKNLCRQERVTLFMGLHAVFCALLHRYTKQDDILVGTPIANRNRSELEPLIGMLVNTVALRTSLSGNPSFRELLARVRQVALDAYEHQDLPFEKLVEELQPARDLSRPPLFQIMFGVQNAPRQAVELAGCNVRVVESFNPTAKFDLTMFVWEAAAELTVVLEYNTDLFAAGTIQRMLGHFRTLFAGAIGNPGERIGSLNLLTEAERKQLLVEWNSTKAEYPEKCIHELVEAQARQTPDAIAVVCGDRQLSYRELNSRGNQLASYLRRKSIGPEDLVGICVERGVEMLVALLGVLKAGAAYVPMDPAYPPERLALMAEDSGLRFTMSQQIVDTECTDENISVGKPDDLAYVIYTSGSTGRPKGVRITHRAVVNFLESMGTSPGMGSRDTLLAVTTLSFDIAALELFLPLCAGGRLVIAPRSAVSDGRELMTLLANSRPTVMQATPATWRMMIDAGWEGVPDLKILCGGEPLSRELAAELLKRGASLWNMYGPTETTIWSAIDKVEREDGPVAVGRPIANTQIHVLDPSDLQLVPVGITGEVYIGGVGLARDYLNRPELTGEKFIASPYSDEPGARLYRTGDVGRRMPDGRLEILGRVDHQVKIRGYRIELGEIESILVSHPKVQDAVVTAMDEHNGEKRLVAYVVPADETPVTIGELRGHLKRKLPDYMAPSAFLVLPALPRTPNGKVDRRALPVPGQERPAMESRFTAPRTAMEETMAGVWRNVLRLEQIGVFDNFFELGGHSLLATRVVAALRTMNIIVPLRTLFERPTIAELCEGMKPAQVNPEPPLIRVARDARRLKPRSGERV